MFIRKTKTNNINHLFLKSDKINNNFYGYAYKNKELTERVSKEELKDHFFNLGQFNIMGTSEGKEITQIFSSGSLEIKLEGYSAGSLMGLISIYSKEIEGKE